MIYETAKTNKCEKYFGAKLSLISVSIKMPSETRKLSQVSHVKMSCMLHLLFKC